MNMNHLALKNSLFRIAITFALLTAFGILTIPSIVSAQKSDRAELGGGTENVVLRWNRVLGQTIETPGQHPGNVLPVRSFAMMHLAMFDAVNSIEGSYEPYLTDVSGSKNASIEAAAAQAAYGVLVGLYPERQAIFAAELAASVEGIPVYRVSQGKRVGSIVAAQMLEARANDGWSAPWTPYFLPATPGNWQELFPGPYPGFAVFTNFPGVTPFAMSKAEQFLPAPPPALSSPEYTASLNTVKELGAANSATRTPDQTLTAILWANPPVSDAAMFGVVRSTSIARNLNTVQNARLFALAFMSFHDALQTTFTSQYHYGLWRPVSAIRRADEDGNPNTNIDPAWNSFLGAAGTPPHPSYASNASSASASISTTLSLFYGRDDITFQIDHGPNGVRNYASFTSLTNEVAQSRVFGGVHFPFDTAAGQSAGRNVATYVFMNKLKPRCR